MINEILLNIKRCLCKAKVEKSDKTEEFYENFPIVYSTGYNINALGLEKLHPFDINKYKRIFADLQQSGYIS